MRRAVSPFASLVARSLLGVGLLASCICFAPTPADAETRTRTRQSADKTWSRNAGYLKLKQEFTRLAGRQIVTAGSVEATVSDVLGSEDRVDGFLRVSGKVVPIFAPAIAEAVTSDLGMGCSVLTSKDGRLAAIVAHSYGGSSGNPGSFQLILLERQYGEMEGGNGYYYVPSKRKHLQWADDR